MVNFKQILQLNRIGPPPRSLSPFDYGQLPSSVSLDSLALARSPSPRPTKVARDLNNNEILPVNQVKSLPPVLPKSRLPRPVQVSQLPPREKAAKKVFSLSGPLYRVKTIEIDESCPVHGTRAVLARSKSSLSIASRQKQTKELHHAPSRIPYCQSPSPRAAANAESSSHCSRSTGKRHLKSGKVQVDSRPLNPPTFPQSYTRMALFGTIGSSQDQKMAKNMAAQARKPASVVPSTKVR